MPADRRIFWLKAAVSAGLLAGLLLSPKLWLSSRAYPLTPAFRFLRPVPPPVDYGVLGAGLLLLVWIAIRPTPPRAIAAFVALFWVYALFDQTRWQPWFYQYLIMLAVLGMSYGKAHNSGRDMTLDTCRWMIAAIYFWSGLHKANATFVEESFLWLVEPFRGYLPEAAYQFLRAQGYVGPAIETAIGIGLLTKQFRMHAVICALGMHAFILASIGPTGHDWDAVVWPWNLAMASFVVLLFRNPPAAPKAGFWRGTPLFHKLVLVLVGIAPLLSFGNLMDGYPSFALYSGNNNAATIYMADSVAGRLPDVIQEQIDVNDSEVDELSLFDWSFAELKVPPYAELRVFRQIGRQICASADNPREMVMIVQTKSTWIRRKRSLAYDCESLSK